MRRAAAKLRGLLETCCDGWAGYDAAKTLVDDPSLERLFERLAAERRLFAEELAAAVESLGEMPRPQGTVRGAIHRGWLKAHTTATALDLLRECAFGERAALERYDEALAADLPPDIRPIVECHRRRLIEIAALLSDLTRSLS